MLGGGGQKTPARLKWVQPLKVSWRHQRRGMSSRMLCQPLQAALQAGNLLPEMMCVLQVGQLMDHQL